jgi:glycine/D-amino acid oxidase-like deaminating enzyme
MNYYARSKKGMPNIRFIDDASTMNPFLKPLQFHGLYNPNDYTCIPIKIIQYLHEKYQFKTEQRTVGSLEDGLSSYDCLIVCAGPWIDELESVGVKPIRGLLLKVTAPNRNQDSIESHVLKSKSKISMMVPTMEYGYGSSSPDNKKGLHFTMSLEMICY